jgi:hypothetical protein
MDPEFPSLKKPNPGVPEKRSYIPPPPGKGWKCVDSDSRLTDATRLTLRRYQVHVHVYENRKQLSYSRLGTGSTVVK